MTGRELLAVLGKACSPISDREGVSMVATCKLRSAQTRIEEAPEALLWYVSPFGLMAVLRSKSGRTFAVRGVVDQYSLLHPSHGGSSSINITAGIYSEPGEVLGTMRAIEAAKNAGVAVFSDGAAAAAVACEYARKGEKYESLLVLEPERIISGLSKAYSKDYYKRNRLHIMRGPRGNIIAVVAEDHAAAVYYAASRKISITHIGPIVEALRGRRSLLSVNLRLTACWGRGGVDRDAKPFVRLLDAGDLERHHTRLGQDIKAGHEVFMQQDRIMRIRIVSGEADDKLVGELGICRLDKALDDGSEDKKCGHHSFPWKPQWGASSSNVQYGILLEDTEENLNCPKEAISINILGG